LVNKIRTVTSPFVPEIERRAYCYGYDNAAPAASADRAAETCQRKLLAGDGLREQSPQNTRAPGIWLDRAPDFSTLDFVGTTGKVFLRCNDALLSGVC
jgi:hypothetical protein